jgi:hypothetical protein
MYRTIVALRVRRTRRELQRHNSDATLRQFADSFQHSFEGQHAHGGARHTRESQSAWFARPFPLLPDIHFGVRDVFAAGWPGRTVSSQ